MTTMDTMNGIAGSNSVGLSSGMLGEEPCDDAGGEVGGLVVDTKTLTVTMILMKPLVLLAVHV